MENLERALRAHPFMVDLEAEHVRFLMGCAANVRFRPGDYLVREGEREDKFFLIRQGTVSMEAPRPGGDAAVVETIGPGDVLGISRVAPQTAHLDARARDMVVAFALDNGCILDKMQADPAFGYAITRRLLERTYDRLARARLQNLDVYR
jgi:CRP/FNR family transcriptional regulator, cyclic AMP receptor protein